MSVALYDWQEPSAAALQASLLRHNVAADGSEMGTGKTIKACVAVKRLARPMFVVCPKAVIADWRCWAARAGVESCLVSNYDIIRTGNTPYGSWRTTGKLFEWNLPKETVIVFDEAHRLGGRDSQQSRLLIAAKTQNYTHALLSGTLIENPLKCRAIGYSLGCHNLLNFWQWAARYGVRDGAFGPEFRPRKETPAQAMERLRLSLGDKFTRIRKADVPGFPQKQVIPVYLQTDDMPEDETLDGGRYGYEARMYVEKLKVPGLVDRAKDLLDDGFSVAIFVNYLGTLTALHKKFPEASVIRGGQSATERNRNIDEFQNNTRHIALIMTQAGGTGISLHDLHGRPRTSLICPGNSAVDFVQAVDRIHRTGALSPAIVHLCFASGVPVERRIRHQIESKLNNLSALNDADLDDLSSHYANTTTQPTNQTRAPDSGGTLPPSSGTTPTTEHVEPDQRPLGETGQPHQPGRASLYRSGDHHGAPAPNGTVPIAGPTPATTPEPQDHATPTETQKPCANLQHPGRSGVQEREPDMVKLHTADIPAANKSPAASTTVHSERKHARCSPSKLKNLEICPSYEPDDHSPVHPVTLRGTAMHEALETNNDSSLDEEEIRLVGMCRDFIAEEMAMAETVIDEQHLKTHDADVQGFVDKLLIFPKHPQTGRRKAAIRDYKMGWNPVDSPEQNPQAMAYTLATFLQWPEVDEVDFAFLIPRLDMVLQHTFTRADVPALKLRISLIAERVRKLSGKEFNPVDENCLYCGRKAGCTPCIQRSLTIARGFDDGKQLVLPANLEPSQLTDPQQIAYGLNIAAVLETWIEQMRRHALAFRKEIGVEIPGYDLVERSAKREIANTVGAWEVLQKEFGVTQEEFLSACKPSITQLETVVKDHAERGEKDRTAERFTDRLMDEGYITRGASFHVLQRSKKKRLTQSSAATP